MRILIIHDRFQFRGGAERLVLILTEALKADLMTEFWTEESFEIPEYFNLPPPLLRKEGGSNSSPYESEDKKSPPFQGGVAGSADRAGVVILYSLII